MAYANLLTHLHKHESNLPLQTISASVSHYLALLPSATPLAAALISSPLFTSGLSHKKLDVLSTSLRAAVHLKLITIDDEPGMGVFSRSKRTRIGTWVKDILAGFKGGMAAMRLACTGGLLLGIRDLESSGKVDLSGSASGKVEDEIVIALAEVMEIFGPREDEKEIGWEKEFWPVVEEEEGDALPLCLILASQSLPLVPDFKIKALPLLNLVSHLSSALSTGFYHGTFLDTLPVSINSKDQYKIQISLTSPLQNTISALLQSYIFTSIAPLSKLTARVLSILIEYKPLFGLESAGQVLRSIGKIGGTVESAWVSGGLSDVAEDDIEPVTKELTTKLWMVLKTLLFATVMVAEAALSSTIYIPPSSFQISSSSPQTLAPAYLALQTLRTLNTLSFIISQFGGVTTTSTSVADFPELKRVFYLGLDILSSDKGLSGEFVRTLCSTKESPGSVAQAKKSFDLACIEQLVSLLEDEALPIVFNYCSPHLSDPTHRETFEKAHSVILGIFAAHAQKLGEGKRLPDDENVTFVHTLVPFYAKCLIENSSDNCLSTDQLRLAYAALVRSASANAIFNSNSNTLALSQYCISALLHAISQTHDRGQSVRLSLTLISTLPSLPLSLIPQTLASIKELILAIDLEERREERIEMVNNLFEETVQRVGDREKEFVMRWWFKEREVLLGLGSDGGAEEKKKGEIPDGTPNPTSRL